MNRNFVLLLLIMLWGLGTSCESRQSTRRSIEKLEESLEGSSDPDLAKTLLDAYVAYIDEYPEDTLYNSRYDYRAAGLAYRMGQTADALAFTRHALELEPYGENSGNAAQLLETIYRDKLQDVFLADLIRDIKEMPGAEKENSGEQAEAILQTIDSLRQQIFDEVTFSVNYGLADRYIKAAGLFSLILPGHPESPQLLLRAAEVSRAIQAYEKAVELLAEINQRYPNSEVNAQAMFLRAFTLDEGLQRYDEARKIYQQFIETYPDDPFADDARFSLDNLGKDVNELIENFEKTKEGGDQ